MASDLSAAMSHDSTRTDSTQPLAPSSASSGPSHPPPPNDLSVDALSAIAIAVDEIVIQPRAGGKLALPAIRIPARAPPPASIPSLDKSAKVGPQNFEKIRVLGAGATGRVYLVKSIGLPTEDFYAMKVVKKSELVKRNRVQRILTEKQILSVAHHPFVVTLHYSFQTPEYFYLVMHYCAGGEFFSFLRRQEKHRLSEAHAKFYAAEVLIALEYLHLLGIIYRDLKPENILVHESGHIMLSDFDLAHEVKTLSRVAVSPVNSFTNVTGFSSSSGHNTPTGSSSPCASSSLPSLGSVASLGTPGLHENSLWFRIVDRKKSTTKPTGSGSGSKSLALSPSLSCLPLKCLCSRPISYPMVDTESHMELGEKRTSFVGTHEYVAPEIIAEEGYVGSVDWWAFGILLYEMIYGTTPFKGSTQIQTLENILDLSEDIDFPSDVSVSEDYKDLIRRLLDKTVSKRLQNPLEIKAHPFFWEIVWPLIRHQKPPIVPDFVHTLREKQFSLEEINTFDDEVPYARGVSSPNTPRRKRQASSPCPSPRAGAITSILVEGEPPSSEPASPQPQRPGTSPSESAAGFTSDAADTSTSTTNFAVVITEAVSIEARSVPPTLGEGVDATGASVTVHNFDYAGGSKPGYWSSAESSRTLHQKLSEMRLASPEGEELRDPQCE